MSASSIASSGGLILHQVPPVAPVPPRQLRHDAISRRSHDAASPAAVLHREVCCPHERLHIRKADLAHAAQELIDRRFRKCGAVGTGTLPKFVPGELLGAKLPQDRLANGAHRRAPLPSAFKGRRALSDREAISGISEVSTGPSMPPRRRARSAADASGTSEAETLSTLSS